MRFAAYLKGVWIFRRPETKKLRRTAPARITKTEKSEYNMGVLRK